MQTSRFTEKLQTHRTKTPREIHVQITRKWLWFQRETQVVCFQDASFYNNLFTEHLQMATLIIYKIVVVVQWLFLLHDFNI